MQRKKRVIKVLSLLVVLVVCGLLINNWFFKLNTMRLPELKKQAAQYVVQQYDACKNGSKSDFTSVDNIDLEDTEIAGPFLGVSKAGPAILNINFYWTISSHGVLIGTVEQDLGLFAIGSNFGTPKMWIQTRNAGLLQEKATVLGLDSCRNKWMASKLPIRWLFWPL